MPTIRALRTLAFGALLCAGLAAIPAWAAPRAPIGPAVAVDACTFLSAPGQIPAPAVITFDDLPDGAAIGGHYAGQGVAFIDSAIGSTLARNAALARSRPNAAFAEEIPPNDPQDAAMTFGFATPQTHVGMFLGNGEETAAGRLQAFDDAGNLICSAALANISHDFTGFAGFRDDAGRIARVTLSYASNLAEAVDDLHFARAAATATPASTQTASVTPTPARTATRTATPTPSRSATATATRGTAAVAPHLAGFPAAGGPGAQLRLNGYGFPPSAPLRLALVCPGVDADLGPAGAAPDGRLQAAAAIPLYPPNPCAVVARHGAVALAAAPFNLLPALQLSFSPQQGPPGTLVAFTVRNLVAGEVRLDYAGLAVAGPALTGAGSYTGSFVVPAGGSAPPGGPVTLRAANLVLGRTAGVADGVFQSEAPPAPVAYRVSDLQLPGAAQTPGSQFILRGRISPAPAGAPDRFKVIAIWRKANGQVFPIGLAQAQIDPSGHFSAPVRVPSLLEGDPSWPETGDKVGVVLLAPGAEAQPFLGDAAPWGLFPTLNVRVVDAANGQLITAAKVSLQPWGAALSAGLLGEVAGQAHTGAFNQVGQVLGGGLQLTDDEKAWIAMTKAMCIPIGIPVDENKWELIGQTLEQALSEPSVQGLLLEGGTQGAAAGGAAAAGAAGGEAAAGRDAPGGGASGASPAAGWAGATLAPAAGAITYLLTVDALDVGYGYKESDGSVKNLNRIVRLHLDDMTWRDAAGALLANPYTVALTKLSSGDQSELGPIKVFAAGIGAPIMPGPNTLPRFEYYHSAKGLPPGVQVQKLADASLYVALSHAQYHKLGPGKLKLLLDGVTIGDFAIQFNPGLLCDKFKGTQQKSLPFYEGKIVIPSAHLLDAGLHDLKVQAQLAGGKWVSYAYGLRVSKLPPSWFSTPTAAVRTLTWSPGEVKLVAPWVDNPAERLLSSKNESGQVETDETGPLDNRARKQITFVSKADASGHRGGSATGSVAGDAINKAGKGCSVDNCPAPTPMAGAAGAGGAAVAGGAAAATGNEPPPATSAPAAASAPAALAANVVTSFSYGPKREDVVPQVQYNIPGFYAGIPFVASLEAGGIIQYAAWVTYGGDVTVYDDGSVYARANVTPTAEIGGGLYIHGYILGGLITAEKAQLLAVMRLSMPSVFDSKAGAKELDACFEYESWLRLFSGWFCIPYTEICAWDEVERVDLFAGEEPDPCGPPGPGSAAAAGAAATGTAAAPAAETPFGSMTLASNGHGKILAVWPHTRSSLAASLFDGAGWGPVELLPAGAGATQPQAAFLTHDRAVIVWTETPYTEAQLLALGKEQALKAQRIAWSVRGPDGWSAPRPLTAATLGEGGAALASCPEWQPGCPAGGAAVAAWERNLSADLSQRRIGVYAARFAGGAWGAVEPVEDARAGAGILPAVAWAGGAPLAAWVRDADGDLTENSSRRIALRFLNGRPVFIPPELPAAIGEMSLAVDGAGTPVLAFTTLSDPGQLLTNARPLWVAGVTCTGPTSCTWQPRMLADPAGRAIYADRPLASVDGSGKVRITFRGMGFGGSTGPQPGDPPGMTLSQGELAQVVVDPAGGPVAPEYLTGDGALNWMPSVAYDPLLDAALAMAVRGGPAAAGAPAGLAPRSGEGGEPAGAPSSALSPAPGLPLAAAAGLGLPDFELTNPLLSGGPAAGEPLRLAVRLANTGAAWSSPPGPAPEVSAAWDGPPGQGLPAGRATLTAFGPTPFITVTLELALPPDGLDAPHVLHVAANPGLPIAESDEADNTIELPAGGIAPPLGLRLRGAPGSGLLFLEWDPVPDRRVAGYRIYRAGGDGTLRPIGASFHPGYVDLGAAPGGAFRYAVAAYTAAGLESPSGPPVSAGPRPQRAYLPLARR